MWGQKEGDQFGGYCSNLRAMREAWTRLTVEDVVRNGQIRDLFWRGSQEGLLTCWIEEKRSWGRFLDVGPEQLEGGQFSGALGYLEPIQQHFRSAVLLTVIVPDLGHSRKQGRPTCPHRTQPSREDRPEIVPGR